MNKQEDTRQTIKAAFANTIANGISLVVGMVVIPIIARILSTEDLGVASSFVSTRNTFVIIATCAVYAYVHRAMLEFDDRKSYIYSIVIYCGMAVMGTFLLGLPFKTEIKRLFSLDDFLYYWLFVSAFIFATYSIGYYYCVFQNKAKIIFGITLLSGPVAQLLAIVLTYVVPHKKYIGRVLGLDSAYILVSLGVIYWLFFRTKQKSFSRFYIQKTLKFTIPIIPHLLSQMVLTQCDLIVISYYAGAGKVGIYSMGHTVGYLALTVMSQIMAVWSPWVYRRFEERDIKAVFDNSKLMILLGMYISMGLIAICPELIKIFLTKDYMPCIYIVPPLVVAMFLQFIYLFLYDLEYYYKKAKYIACASVIAAVLNLILNIIFVQKYGYIAACYTTVVSYLLLVLINYIFSGKLNVANVYSVKYIIGSIIAVGIYAISMMLLKDCIILRYVLFILISVLLLMLEWKDIKVMIKNLRR